MANPQDSIDQLTESVQRLRLMAKMLWQVDGLDKVGVGNAVPDAFQRVRQHFPAIGGA